MTQESIVITEEKVHPDAVALLKDYRLVYTGAKFTQEELVALVSKRSGPRRLLTTGDLRQIEFQWARHLLILRRPQGRLRCCEPHAPPPVRCRRR